MYVYRYICINMHIYIKHLRAPQIVKFELVFLHEPFDVRLFTIALLKFESHQVVRCLTPRILCFEYVMAHMNRS